MLPAFRAHRSLNSGSGINPVVAGKQYRFDKDIPLRRIAPGGEYPPRIRINGWLSSMYTTRRVKRSLQNLVFATVVCFLTLVVYLLNVFYSVHSSPQMNNSMNTQIQSASVLQSSIQLGTAGAKSATQSEDPPPSSVRQSTFLQHILEGFMDGVLILSEQGKLIYSNSYARQMCRLLKPELTQFNRVPPQIWRICEALLDSRSTFPDRSFVIEDEIFVGSTVLIRIRARWLELHEVERPYLSVTLEDRYQSLQNAVIAEAQKYNLTPRETQVWLLRRTNCTYKAIASELHIAIDTVKKHLKNIHAKREAFLWANEG